MDIRLQDSEHNYRQFIFNSDINVKIKELNSADYGCIVWPSAPILCQFICHHKKEFKTKSVIELGSGTGIVGILAAKVGANVVMTDSPQYAHCLELCKFNANLNDVNDNIKIVELKWGCFSKQFVDLDKCDFIISSDCFYDQKDFEDIIATVSFIMDKHQSKHTIFYTTYQERCSDWSIECLLSRWKLTCDYISLDTFDAKLDKSHTIRMLKITQL